jgi:hypothetical protein
MAGICLAGLAERNDQKRPFPSTARNDAWTRSLKRENKLQCSTEPNARAACGSSFALDLLSHLGLPEACPLLQQSDRAIEKLSSESY